jgi:tetratricopeptide (TPR) repeat protein
VVKRHGRPVIAACALLFGVGAEALAEPALQPSKAVGSPHATVATPSVEKPTAGQAALTTEPKPESKTSNAEGLNSQWLIKPGQSISVSMATEDIVCTNDLALARKQREAYPDSAEASFIYAVALSRTSQVETALQEVRRARKLAEKDGGPAYFDQMIQSYEKMLTYYPEDNQVRYHLAWAYYMKAYLLAKYSGQAAGQNPKYAEWIAQAKKPADPSPVLGNLTQIRKDMSQVSPDAVPQVKRYYELALAKLDDLLARQPDDVWARVYRAHLQAESTGNIDQAIVEWQKVKEASPLNPAAYFFLGEGYLKKGNLKESLTNVSKAIALRATGN